MSLLNKASLIQIPSGYKDGTLYSAKPTNGDGDFTFSRGSNLAATRVNSEGLIEKGRENIAIYSQDTTNAVYAKTNISVTSNNATAPDGTLTADTITATANGATLQGVVTAVNGRVYTISVYIKRRTGSGQVALRGINNTTTNITITSEWQRYEVFMVTNSTNGRYGVYLATLGDEVDVWGFQLEESLVATDYIETTTTTEQAGILEDMPRLDYSGGASCPSLLLEPSATALNQQSEYYDAYWTKENITISSNDTTSPEGVANASKINETASTTYFALSKGFTISSGSNHTISVFAKADERNFLIIRTNLLGSNVNTTFNLSTGVVTYNAHTSASIESYSNGWYRCSITASSSSTSLNMAIVISNADVTSNVLPTYLGVAGSGLHIYGINVMASGYLQSYIPTYGSSVTRGLEYGYNSITSALTSNEGTLFIHLNDGADSGGYGSGALSIGLDGTNNFIGWASNSLASTELRAIYKVSGTTYYLGSSTPINTESKILVRWGNGSVSFFKNGALFNTQSTADFSGQPLTSYLLPNQFRTGNFPIKQTLVFPTALTDAECEQLTTL